MYLEQLNLEQFRSYEKLELCLPREGFRIVGRNASGKSSLLEAIVMLSTTRSPRASADRDIVGWESGRDYGVPPFSRIAGRVATARGRHDVGIVIEIDQQRASHARKQFLLDQRSVRAHTLIGTLRSVLFSPEDVDLVSGPPSERRRQVDILISQIDRHYLQRLSRYGRILTQRNGLLKRFARDGIRVSDQGASTQLSFWDEELVASGAYLVASRARACATLSTFLDLRSRHLVDGATIAFAYQPNLSMPRMDAANPFTELVQHVAVALKDQLSSTRAEEYRRGQSVVGPHRDDFAFTIDDRSLARSGSRGQQRLGVVAYKLAESDVIDEMTGDRPLLLLDDVLSELDAVHRDKLLRTVSAFGCQLVVTATEEALLRHESVQHLEQLVIETGRVIGA